MGRKVVDKGTSTIHQLQGLDLASPRETLPRRLFLCPETFVVALKHLEERNRHRLPSPIEEAGRMLDGVAIGPSICCDYPAGHDRGVEIR
jgi:hypothetical protein